MLVLGIETACDDTSAAIVEDGQNVLSNVVWTQDTVHKKFGGVVPELAARQHVEVINHVIQESLDVANISINQVELVGVNHKHGLLRSIIVGVAAAKAIAYSCEVPLVGVHHIEGHIYSNIIQNQQIEFPHVCLTVAGGHNLLIYVMGHGKYELIGRTLDDAAGEAFDKVAKLLGLGFPGGPIIDKLSRQGNPKAFKFPRPMMNQPNYDFSFSGLKTAVTNKVKELRQASEEINAADIAASFQYAAVDVLVAKTIQAAISKNVSTITLAGGVSANKLLREMLVDSASQQGLKVIFPTDFSLCTDNGAMIATLAYYKYKQGITSPMDLDAMANAPIGNPKNVYK